MILVVVYKMSVIYFVFFFFTSIRRHTRWPRDWSSDVLLFRSKCSWVVGLDVTGFTNQLHFLINLGIESTFAGLDLESPQVAAMRELLRPDGMGTTYKVLIQHKGMLAPQLDGLRSRPYFLDALGVPERRPGRSLENVVP